MGFDDVFEVNAAAGEEAGSVKPQTILLSDREEQLPLIIAACPSVVCGPRSGVAFSIP